MPFEIKLQQPAELGDGYGSYICEFGHTHDYSRFDFEAAERELADPDLKTYGSAEELIAAMEAEDAYE